MISRLVYDMVEGRWKGCRGSRFLSERQSPGPERRKKRVRDQLKAGMGQLGGGE